MSDSVSKPKPSFSKVRVLAGTVADTAIDLLLPTAIYFLLAPTHRSAIVRLTIGGYFVAAKASAGHLSTDDARARSIQASFEPSRLAR